MICSVHRVAFRFALTAFLGSTLLSTAFTTNACAQIILNPSSGNTSQASPPAYEGGSRISAAQARLAARAVNANRHDNLGWSDQPQDPLDVAPPNPTIPPLAVNNAGPAQAPTVSPQTPPAGGTGATNPAATNATQSGPSPEAAAISLEAIQTQLQQIQSVVDIEPTIKQDLVAAYEAMLAESKKRLEEEKSLKEFTTALEAAPIATTEAKRRKENPTFQSPFADGTLPWSRVETLQAMLLDTTALLQAATKVRSDLETTLATRDARRKEIPRYINEDKALITKLSDELAVPPAEGIDPRLREANQLLIRARLANANARLRRLELEQRTYDAESELLPIRKELLIAEEKFYQLKLKEINEELSKRRENQIAKQKRIVEDLLKQSKSGLNPEAKRIVQRTDDWLKLVKDHAALRLRIDETRAQQKQWSDRYKIMTDRMSRDRKIEGSADRSFSMSRMKSLVGEMLRRQGNDLPSIDKLNQQLEDYQSRLQSTQSIILTLDDWKAENPISADPTQPTLDLENAISEYAALPKEQQAWVLDATERKIVDDFRLDASTYSETLFNLADLNQQLIDQVREYRSFIDEHILWIRSTDPFGPSDLQNLGRSIQEFLDFSKWSAVPVSLWADMKRHAYAYVVALFALMTMVLYNKKMREMVQALGVLAKKSNTTSFSPTAKTVVLSLLMSLPLALLHLALGWRLTDQAGSNKFVEAVGMGLLLGARYFLPLEFFRQVARSGGLAENHFQWSLHSTALLRKHLRWFIDLGIPAVLLVGIVSTYSDARWENSLGRVAFCVLMLLCSIVMLRLFQPRHGVFREYLTLHSGGWIDRLRFFWYFGVALAPIALGTMSLAGYHYTATRLAMHLHTSIAALAGLLLLFSTIWRWLLLQRRQLVIAQARQRLEEARRRDADAGNTVAGVAPVAFESVSDLSQINAQTMRLISSTMIVAALAVVAFIWSSILPAVGVLDSVTLWSVSGTTPEDKLPVTLANLLIAIPAAIMTMVAARNLPGLLEIALLQHLPLENAVRYAITSISRYAIFTLGIAMTFNSLGVRWASIQWLVAALGVGLGFGLQEIFANFVSGLILLFEQPVRVGDVVTVGDTTGVISKIRMRATTVQNFDNQELVIPNKDLVTGRLLNWTLSDSVTRLSIEVGIAYGSDVTRACRLLREICENHPNVLKTPEPTAFFEVLGDSQLVITVRIFVQSLDLRLPTRHEVLTEIHRRFAAEKIEIPFPQRELHIRSLPQELALALATKPL